MRVIAILPFVLFLSAYALATIEPQSPEAWRYAAIQGKRYVPFIYEQSDKGLVCKQARESDTRALIEALAAEHSVHPAEIAEDLSVYLWSDWSVFYVSGYDLLNFMARPQSAADFGTFLDTFYREHHACLVATMRVLVAGYEGQYVQDAHGSYHYDHAAEAEKYKLYALEPKHFPGTGLFEPLGIVYMSRYADLLSIGWVRKQVVNHFASVVEARNAAGNPLKVTE